MDRCEVQWIEERSFPFPLLDSIQSSSLFSDLKSIKETFILFTCSISVVVVLVVVVVEEKNKCCSLSHLTPLNSLRICDLSFGFTALPGG